MSTVEKECYCKRFWAFLKCHQMSDSAMPLGEKAKMTAVSSVTHITGKENSFAGHLTCEAAVSSATAGCKADVFGNTSGMITSLPPMAGLMTGQE